MVRSREPSDTTDESVVSVERTVIAAADGDDARATHEIPTRPSVPVGGAEIDPSFAEDAGELTDAEIAPDPVIGEVVGGYELLSLLGKGGAAAVFRARRRKDGTIVALKVLFRDKVKGGRIVQRFIDEANTAGMVKHPALVGLVEYLEQKRPRRYAYAMEYVEGESLRDRLDWEHALDLLEACAIARQIAEGVHALHHAGVIHRDLKPENVMLSHPLYPGGPPRVKLLDYGVAKIVSAVAQLEAMAQTSGTFVGTPKYMAPEQAMGTAIDGRADLFALGVILFEMITGTRPHEGDSLKAVVMAKIHQAPRVTATQREVLPQEISDLVDSSLRLDPGARPPDARTFITRLDEGIAVLAVVGSIRVTPDKRSSPGPAPSRGPERSGPSPPNRRADPVSPLPTPGLREAAASPRPTADPATLSTKRPTLLVVAAVAALLSVVGLIGVLTRKEEAESIYIAPRPAESPHAVFLDTRPAGARIVDATGRTLGRTPSKVLVPAGGVLPVQVLLDGHKPLELTFSKLTAPEVLYDLEALPPVEVAPAKPTPPVEAAPPKPEPRPRPLEEARPRPPPVDAPPEAAEPLPDEP